MAQDEQERQQRQQQFERIVAQEGQRFRGWRTVPTHNASLGATAKAVSLLFSNASLTVEMGSEPIHSILNESCM